MEDSLNVFEEANDLLIVLALGHSDFLQKVTLGRFVQDWLESSGPRTLAAVLPVLSPFFPRDSCRYCPIPHQSAV
jgi:hypothetical protein